MGAFEDDLRAALGDPSRLLTRDIDRAKYAPDASHYVLTPRAAVLAATADEVGRIMAVSSMHRVPAVFRSGGTSLSGQGITDGLLVETRRRFRDIDIRDGGALVAVGAGMTVREVNVRLASYGRKLGPDPASEVACTVGGVVANNSSGMTCGTHANTYRTLQSMTLVLPSGTVIDTAAYDADDALRDREPVLHAGLLGLRDRIRADPAAVREINRQFAMKNTMGYGINSFLDHDSPVQILAHLMVGSEGTLGFIAQVVFRTVPLLPNAATGLLVFPDLRAATDALPALVATEAQCIELMDAASLRVAQRDALASEDLHAAVISTQAALLVEWQAASAAEVESIAAAATQVIRDLPLTSPAALTLDPAARGRLWRIRKGLFTTIAGARPAGTTSLLEDVVVPAPALTDTCAALQGLFSKHGYAGAAVFGHARDSNMHFMLTQAFETAADVDRYAAFTEDMVELVLGHGGSLKAEHGTGRVMAPFVRRQYGDALYDVMREIKALCDPAGVLNPGVILDEDPRAHLRHLKVVTVVDPEVDRCVECGYCEPVCPSRDLTTTPRQRIVLRRAMASLRPGDPVRASIEKDYGYDAVDTCATDGMCAVNCPVGINTGELMKRLRSESQGAMSRRVGNAAAEHWQGFHVIRAHRIAHRSSIADSGDKAGDSNGAARARRGRRTGVVGRLARCRCWPANFAAAGQRGCGFFASCLSNVFSPAAGGQGAAAAFLSLCDRAAIGVHVPERLDALCCGAPFESKGHVRGAATMAAKVVAALWEASRAGELPIVCDASSCTQGLTELAKHLPQKAAEQYAALQIIDATAFSASRVLPALTVKNRLPSLALHPTCATTHLGAGDALRILAAATADEVYVPAAWGCCAYAGDRGMLHPELTASATADQARELAQREFAAYASSNRTCELGMSAATGKAYRHILEILDDATRQQGTGV